jgi:hypothetical protein
MPLRKDARGQTPDDQQENDQQAPVDGDVDACDTHEVQSTHAA